MINLTLLDVVTLIAALASIIIAMIAIWLSIVFFKMSSANSEVIKESSKDIGSNVNKLEKLFEKLYADTFSMMRDTYSDMRKHIWPEDTKDENTYNEIVEKTDKRFNELRNEFMETVEGQLRVLSTKQSMTEEVVSELRTNLSRLLDEAISSSRKVVAEVQEETMRERILLSFNHLNEMKEDVTANDLVVFMMEKYKCTFQKTIAELDVMKKEDILLWKGDLGSNTIIYKVGDFL